MSEDNKAAMNRVVDNLFRIMREKADAGEPGAQSFFRTRYEAVICAAGHLLTGEGEPPTECPICKGEPQ